MYCRHGALCCLRGGTGWIFSCKSASGKHGHGLYQNVYTDTFHQCHHVPWLSVGMLPPDYLTSLHGCDNEYRAVTHKQCCTSQPAAMGGEGSTTGQLLLLLKLWSVFAPPFSFLKIKADLSPAAPLRPNPPPTRRFKLPYSFFVCKCFMFFVEKVFCDESRLFNNSISFLLFWERSIDYHSTSNLYSSTNVFW